MELANTTPLGLPMGVIFVLRWADYTPVQTTTTLKLARYLSHSSLPGFSCSSDAMHLQDSWLGIPYKPKYAHGSLHNPSKKVVSSLQQLVPIAIWSSFQNHQFENPKKCINQLVVEIEKPLSVDGKHSDADKNVPFLF